jgi:hypothetical protein
VTPLIKGNVSEAVYHSSFISCLKTIFNWDDVNIKDKYPVPMGSTTKEADIILEGNGFNIVIEMKQPEIILGNEHTGQLISYMRILGYKYGLLVGKKIKLFYDYDRNKKPNEIEEILSLDFNVNNEEGKILGELLDNTVCSDNKLHEYSEMRIKNFQKLQLVKQLKNDFEVSNFKKIKEIVKDGLLQDGYDEDVINIILEEIKISFTKIDNNQFNKIDENKKTYNNYILDEIMAYYNSICDKNFMCYGNNKNYRQIAIIKPIKNFLHYEFIIRNITFVGVEIHAESRKLIVLNDVMSSFTGKINGYTIGHRIVKGKDYIQILVPYSAGKEMCSNVMKQLVELTYEKILNEYKNLEI